MQLKNDNERNAFLTDYRNADNGWFLWKEDKDLGRRWWRREFDGCSFVVEENLRTSTWPKVQVTWWVLQWFVIDRDQEKPFADYAASITQVRTVLKQMTKDGRAV